MDTTFTSGVALAGSVSIAGLYFGALTRTGCLAATCIGVLIFKAGGFGWSGILVLFFATSSALTHLPGARRTAHALISQKGSRRDAVQVLANGGIPAAYAVLSLAHSTTSWTAGFATAVASATADTWATEIGTRYGRNPTRITDRTAVPPGTSGGTTRAGAVASAIGSLCIAAASIPALGLSASTAAIVAASGVVGSIVDSFLGATVQERRWCTVCAQSTEQLFHGCGTRTLHVGGIARVDNDVVNALSNVASSLLCVVFILVILR